MAPTARKYQNGLFDLFDSSEPQRPYGRSQQEKMERKIRELQEAEKRLAKKVRERRDSTQQRGRRRESRRHDDEKRTHPSRKTSGEGRDSPPRWMDRVRCKIALNNEDSPSRPHMPSPHRRVYTPSPTRARRPKSKNPNLEEAQRVREKIRSRSASRQRARSASQQRERSSSQQRERSPSPHIERHASRHKERSNSPRHRERNASQPKSQAHAKSEAREESPRRREKNARLSRPPKPEKDNSIVESQESRPKRDEEELSPTNKLTRHQSDNRVEGKEERERNLYPIGPIQPKQSRSLPPEKNRDRHRSMTTKDKLRHSQNPPRENKRGGHDMLKTDAEKLVELINSEDNESAFGEIIGDNFKSEFYRDSPNQESKRHGVKEKNDFEAANRKKQERSGKQRRRPVHYDFSMDTAFSAGTQMLGDCWCASFDQWLAKMVGLP